MDSGFITPQDPRWMRFLQQTPHDFYHLPGYLELSARVEGGTPVAFFAEDGAAAFLAPLLLSPLPDGLNNGGWQDALTPYGYPTPLISPFANEALLQHFLEEYIRVCSEQQIVTTFFRLHPLLSLSEQSLQLFGQLVEHGETVSIDLSKSEDQLWSDTRRDHRAGIRKLHKNGFFAAVDDWQLLDQFVLIYQSTMERLSARAFYSFSHEYFYALRDALGNDFHLCTVMSPEGEMAAAGVFTTTSGIVQFHLSGTASAYRKVAPTKLMLHHMRLWGKEAGHRVFHLGGGLGAARDSLFEFKAGFSDRRHTFYTYRMVADRPQYRDLVARWRQQFGDAIDPNFFPEYRAPVLQAGR